MTRGFDRRNEILEVENASSGISVDHLQNAMSPTDARSPQGGRYIRPALSPLQSTCRSRASTPNCPPHVLDTALTEEDGEYHMEESSWEYYEPWSWRAICTETGSKWMQRVTGSHDFVRSVKVFKETLNPISKAAEDRYLTLIPNYAEIDEAQAWEYVNGEFTSDTQNCNAYGADNSILRKLLGSRPWDS